MSIGVEVRSYKAVTPYGTFTRNSKRLYTHCVARADGWHMFSQSRAAAEAEVFYQRRKGRETTLVEVQS